MSDALGIIARRLLVADRLHYGEGNQHARLSAEAIAVATQLAHDGRPCVWARLMVVAALGYVREWQAMYALASVREAGSSLVMRTLCIVGEAEDGRLFAPPAEVHPASGKNHERMAG